MRAFWLAAFVAVGGACAARGGAGAQPGATAAAERDALVWSPWSRDSFAAAAADERLILVNVVASWCHWCHVMDETTYADPEVVALLRDHFVTIRVDSDARPDLAERYREWGWPATGVLSPDAQPVLELRGYQPPRAFAALLRELLDDRAHGRLARRAPPAASATRPHALEAIRAAADAQLEGFYEPQQGGWGRAQRYPAPGPIEHALLRARLTGDARLAERAMTTLRSARKLIDPVFGGMYQYSVAGDWDHPHFEKITAIQAGAIRNYALAYRTDGDPLWLDAARDVARYMTTMMRAPEGGFYTAQDADLRVADRAPVPGATYYAKGEAERRALGIPTIDRHIYADLNGMMIEALCELYAATGDDEVLAVAESTAQRLLDTHATAAGAFTHGADEGPHARLYLRDQVAMGRAMLALYRSTGRSAWLERADRLGSVLLGGFHDGQHGGFFAHTADPEAVGVFAVRRRPHEENGTAARFLAQLHRYRDGDGTAPTPYLAAAERALQALGDPAAVAAEGRIIGHYLLGLEEVLMPTVDVTVVGDLADGGATAALHRAVLRYPEPRAVIESSKPGERYPDVGKPAVYLCTASACSSPITRPERFAAAADAFIRSSLPPR